MLNKRRLLALLIVVTSLACSNSSINKEKANSEVPPDGYEIGNIYIGNQEYLDSLENLNYNDVLILDMRDDEDDPTIKIYDSYKINDSNSIDKIINFLLEYEQENPSAWDRTYDSMRYEMLMHNFAYFLNYQIERSKDVDLNNKDEIKYLKKSNIG